MARTKAKAAEEAEANGAKLSETEVEARSFFLVATITEIDKVEAAKKADNKRHGEKLKQLKERRDELREEVETGMLHPSKRQADLPMGGDA